MEPQISEGDFVIAQKKELPNNNDIIVCVHGEEAIIKKFFKHENQIVLISLNAQKHPPIPVTKYFKVEGIVKNIIKYNK